MNNEKLNLWFYLDGASDASIQPTFATEEDVHQFLHTGLQQLLTLLCLVQLSGLKESQETPAGITDKFVNAFTRPVLGKLLEFCIWLSQYQTEPSVEVIAQYFLSSEKGKPGWIQKCITLRNQYFHSKQLPKEEVIELVREHLEMIPGFGDFGHFDLTAEDIFQWCSDKNTLNVPPFISSSEGQLSFLAELDKRSFSKNQNGEAHETEALSKWFSDIRIADNLLGDPTKKELVKKIENRNIQPSNKHTDKHQFPGFDQKTFVLLTDSQSTKLVSAAFCSKSELALSMQVSLESSKKPLAVLSNFIGIRNELSFEQLVEISALRPLLLAFDASNLETRTFLKLLYWVYDLSTLSRQQNLKVVIARDLEKLRAEEQLLWEELPADFHDLLYRNRTSRNNGIMANFWNLNMSTSWVDRLLKAFK